MQRVSAVLGPGNKPQAPVAMRHESYRHFAKLTLFVAAYYGLAVLSLRLPILPASAAMASLPTALGVAVLTLGGLRFWPGVAAGAMLIGWRLGTPLPAMVIIAAGNSLQAVLAAGILRKWRVDGHLAQVSDVLLLTGVCTLIAPLPGALAGAVAQHWILAEIGWTFWELVYLRALADATALIIIAPLLLVFGTMTPTSIRPTRMLEAAVILLVLSVTGYASFGGHWVEGGMGRALASLDVAVVVWAAFRFGQPGATAAMLIIGVLAATGAAKGIGPFSRELDIETMAGLCAYLSIVAFVGLVLAAAVTERAAVRRSLAASEERYRQLVDFSPDAIVVHQDMRVVYVNRRALRLLGARDPSQLLGVCVLELVHPAHRPAVQDRIAALTYGSAPGPLMEQTLVRLGGTPVAVEVVATACVYHGAPAVQAILRDITERREAQEALRAGERRYQSLFMRIPEPTLVYDRASLRILAVNEAAVVQYGYSRDEFLRLRITQIRLPEDVARLQENLVNHPKSHANRGRWRHLTKDGRILHVEIVADEIEFDGREARIVMMRNITEQIEADAALRRSEEHYRQAAESNRRLLSEVNHRVRNNLASLLGLIELSQRDSRDVAGFSDSLQMRIRAMGQVHNLLVDASWQDLNFDALLRDFLHWMRRGSEHDVPVIMNGPATPISPRQALPLAMTIQELLTNSIKHGAHGCPTGTIEIHWEVVAREGFPDRLRIHWREQGGPPIQGPIRPSLGTQLIEGFIRFELGGQCQLRYPRQGADHLLEFDLEPEEARAKAS